MWAVTHPINSHLGHYPAMKPLHSLLKTLYHGDKFEVLCGKPTADKKPRVNLAPTLRYNKAMRLVNQVLVWL